MLHVEGWHSRNRHSLACTSKASSHCDSQTQLGRKEASCAAERPLAGAQVATDRLLARTTSAPRRHHHQDWHRVNHLWWDVLSCGGVAAHIIMMHQLHLTGKDQCCLLSRAGTFSCLHMLLTTKGYDHNTPLHKSTEVFEYRFNRYSQLFSSI